MGINQGSISVNQKAPIVPAPGFPFTIGSARNGLSVDATGRIVLGQDVGAIGDPAQLINNREIPLAGFTLDLRGITLNLLVDDATTDFLLTDAAANPFFDVDIANHTWLIGDFNAGQNVLFADAATGTSMSYATGFTILFSVGDNAAGTSSILQSPDIVSRVELQHASSGGGGILAGTSVGLNSATTVTIGAPTGVFLPGGANLLFTTAALGNNAGVAAGTLLNAPSAGNPTKWIAINDNGTIRKIPTWL